ncbi:hypothetical protein J4449_00305 [Candidatus Woesearchaeota archaeon]|nr:hypothetical protein [Candidatus Woesearchaeota archaeon]
MEAIANSTVIILLAKIRRLDLLNIFKIIITTKVEEEILGSKKVISENKYLEEYVKEKIRIEDPIEEMSLDLDSEENSAISLCKQKNINWFFSDDKRARKTAELLQIKTKGLIGVILENLREKKITKNEAKEILKISVTLNSYYISADIYAKAIELIDDF